MRHTELMHAYTTAAVINWSMGAPEKPVSETVFMPNFRPAREPEPIGPPIEDDELSTYQSKVANLAALLEAYAATGKADPQLIALGLVSANE